MRVLTVVGARPQFVKAAPVSRAIRARHEEVLLHTGQHVGDAMSGAFFRDLGIAEPDLVLDLPAAGAGRAPGGRIAAMVRGIAAAIRAHRPHAVVVFGDTDSTLAGAFAACEAGVPLAHVESGLRSGVLSMPEEGNRIATDHVAALLLCPTRGAAETLRAERARGRVEVVGDVMLDALLAVTATARAKAVPQRYGLAERGYYVATVHRAANTDDPGRLRALVTGLASLDLPTVLPCHPRTADALARIGLVPPGTAGGGLRVVDPLPYTEMIGLVADARGVLTDSGGLQKEAYFLGVPCVTLRAETEWRMTVESGWNRLVPGGAEEIRAAAAAMRAPAVEGSRPDLSAYGDGRAAERVASLVGDLAP